MGIVTKRNGKILMILGVLLVVIGFLGFEILIAMFGEASIYTPLAGLFIFLLIIIGPLLAAVGIPLFIIGAKRVPSKLMDILKSSPHIRTRIKISFLARQLGINEKDVVSTVSRLRSNGEPISIDDSTLEVIYNPTPSPPIAPPSQLEMEAKPLEKPAQKGVSIFVRIGRFLLAIFVGTLTRLVLAEFLAGIVMSFVAYLVGGGESIYALFFLLLFLLVPGIVAGIIARGAKTGAVAGCLAGLISATLRQISLASTILVVIVLMIGGWFGGREAVKEGL